MGEGIYRKTQLGNESAELEGSKQILRCGQLFILRKRTGKEMRSNADVASGPLSGYIQQINNRSTT